MIREAIETLPVQRIGHGVRAIEDKALVDELAARAITLEVCPGSNIATGIYESRQTHPLLALRAAGVRVTLNSDDPPYFATTVGREYDRAAQEMQLGEEALCGITNTAIDAAFVDDETKQMLRQRAAAAD
jgi:adenosine deaminase